MIKIDLITGFLGSGKTTFIKKYAKYCMEQGEQLGILEKDYGAVNVDMMLLQDLIGENCDLEMIPPAFDADCQRRRFKSKLITMGMCGYDRVIMEPSGIYDVDEFFEVIAEDPINRWFEIDNVIAIVDAGLEEELSEDADYLLAAQTAKAGKILFSKTQLVEEESIEKTKNHIKEALSKIKLERNLDELILLKDWKDLDEGDYQDIKSAGYVNNSHVKFFLEDQNAFATLIYMNTHMSRAKIQEIIPKLMADSSLGNIIRIKGFLLEEVDGQEHCTQMNATKTSLVFEDIPKGQEVFIVIGENLDQARIDAYF